MSKILLSSAALLTIGQTAFAQTAEGTRGEVYCYPAKDIPNLVKRINSVEAKRRDVVDVKIDPKLIIKDSGVWPDSVYLTRGGETITEMPFSREDGRIPSFIEAVNAAPDSNICIADPTRADKPADDEGLYFEMGLSPFFLSSSGSHDIDDIKEGSRDAKSFYKKMIPAAFRMFMPDTNYLAVKYQDPNVNAAIFARVDDEDIALEFERHKEMFVVSGQALRKMGASALIIRGGEYDLQPVPSPSVMRRFGLGGNADVSDEETEAKFDEIGRNPTGDANDTEITPEN